MPHDVDPIELTPAERMRELAALLTRGLLRSRARAGTPPDPTSEKPFKTGTNDLAVPPDTSVTVHAG